jgi:hypothetical protein
LFSEMEYPHWMMVAGAWLVVAGFIGLGFSRYMNRAPAEDNLHPEPPSNSSVETGFAWHRSNLEDFSDFYHSGVHRGDDAFGPMEQHHIEKKGLKLLRNIDHFACLRRHIEKPQPEEFHPSVRGPRFFLPPRKGLDSEES